MDRIIISCENIEIIAKGKVLKQRNDKNGYKLVNLNITSVGKFTARVHRLVAEHFLQNDNKEKNQINHKNMIKHDNHVDNLEWVTHQENQTHARKNKKWDIYGTK